MRFEYLFAFLLSHLCHQVTCDDEALRECANIHHISIQVIPNVHATFANHKCLLTCLVGNKTLASDPINEGVACPLDSNGICHNGQCIGSQEEAIVECGKLHSMDFHLVRNSGTQYANSLCQLKCMIDGNVIGLHGANEGLQCPKDFNGVCRNSQCITASETKSTIAPTTAPAKTQITPTSNPETAPVEVYFNSAYSNDTNKNIFHVQICFQYNKTAPIYWNSCDLSWTSGIIHESNTNREKCFTIRQHTPYSTLAGRLFYNSNIYFDIDNSYENHIFQKQLDEWGLRFYDNYFSFGLWFKKMA